MRGSIKILFFVNTFLFTIWYNNLARIKEIYLEDSFILRLRFWILVFLDCPAMVRIEGSTYV